MLIKLWQANLNKPDMNGVPQEPKDLGIKIAVNETQVFWEKFKKQAEHDIEFNRHQVEVDEHILILCKKKIKEEIDKFK